MSILKPKKLVNIFNFTFKKITKNKKNHAIARLMGYLLTVRLFLQDNLRKLQKI